MTVPTCVTLKHPNLQKVLLSSLLMHLEYIWNRKLQQRVVDCAANATAYIPTDPSAKCEFILLTQAVFLQDAATLWCFYLFLNRKLDFLPAHMFFMDFFCSASVPFFWFVSWETSGFPWALGVEDSVCGAVDKWSLFGVTLSHSQAINLLQSKQQLSSMSPDCCKQRPWRINVRMRALQGQRVHKLRIRDQINSQL